MPRKALAKAAFAAALVTLPVAFAAAVLGDGEVAGAVYFEDGSPAAGARVVLVPGGYNTSAASDGTFRLSAPPGLYTVRATAENATVESRVEVKAAAATSAVLKIERRTYLASQPNFFPFAFLALSMLAVAAGGFYVNKRMAESGIDVNKTVIGGAPVRKPFRRRRKKTPPR